MGTTRTLDRDADLGETIDFLASCEHALPKTRMAFAREFDWLSKKSLITLYREHHLKELKIYQHPDTGVVHLARTTSRGIVLNPTERKIIIEVSRSYEKEGKILTVPNFPLTITPGEPFSLEIFSTSETIRQHEQPIDTLMRALKEEMDVEPGRIRPRDLERFGRDVPHFPEPPHKSSVYETAMSENETTWFVVETHQLSSNFKFKNMNKRDNGAILNREWFDLDDPQQYGL